MLLDMKVTTIGKVIRTLGAKLGQTTLFFCLVFVPPLYIHSCKILES
jgi:hypothetical protein